MVNLTWIGWSAVLYSTRFSERAVGCRALSQNAHQFDAAERGASPLCVRARRRRTEGAQRRWRTRDASARQNRTGKGMRWARIHMNNEL